MEKSGTWIRQMEMMAVMRRNNIEFWTLTVSHMICCSDNIIEIYVYILEKLKGRKKSFILMSNGRWGLTQRCSCCLINGS